ncbi:MAG: dephospho-CoA kinase [Pseudomonadota bacterium]|nr:dephospho-CoA kinase [Pseudomonadota bacterium]
MKKIGITGSLASGKTTASKILSMRKGPLFSADDVVKKLYTKAYFRKILSKKFKIKDDQKFKNSLRKKVLNDKSFIKKLEKMIHPIVRREMRKFIKINKKKSLIFLEIPLLVESNLVKYFDVIFFIKAKKKIRLQRFIYKGGNKNLFNILNEKQLSDSKKSSKCDYVVVNEKNIKILKKKLLDILKKYE